jgi:hypothetical protein
MSGFRAAPSSSRTHTPKRSLPALNGEASEVQAPEDK